jgi:hypothetical protein
MMRKVALLLFTGAMFVFMSGCGNQSSTPPSTTSSNLSQASVGLSVTDTPPSGVTVLFFQLNITAATLTSASGSNVSLLPSNGSIPVNVTQLQTDSAFLGTQNVTAGEQFTSLALTFANPELTIYNGTGAAMGSCANDTVCQLQPTTTPLTLTFSSSPFPITVGSSSFAAFLLDINLNTVIQNTVTGGNLSVNLAATNGVTIAQLPVQQPHMGYVEGTIESTFTSTPSNSSQDGFTLQTPDGRTLTIDVNSSTTYNYPSSVCSTDNFACVATQQVVQAELTWANGALTATQVTYESAAGVMVFEGNIIRLSTSNGNTMMDLILQRGPAAPHSFQFGQRATVTVPSTGVTYGVDNGSFTIPSGLSFASASDLMAGQDVFVAVEGSLSNTSANSSPWMGPGPITFTTNSITLGPSQITGTVAATDASALSFTLSTFPNFFMPPAPNATSMPSWAPVNVTIQTTSGTTFSNFTTNTIGGVAINNVVSVGGWVFSTPNSSPTVTIAASQVMLRPGPTPLF